VRWRYAKWAIFLCSVAAIGAGAAPVQAITFSRQSVGFSGLIAPAGAAIDQAADVFVVDQNGRVLERPVDGSQQVVLPFSGLSNPVGLAADRAGDCL
jgi:hypothetical protein